MYRSGFWHLDIWKKKIFTSHRKTFKPWISYICISIFCYFCIPCYVGRQEFEESHSVPHCIISFHFPLACGLATLQLKSSRHPTGKICLGSIDLCIVYPLLWLLCDGCRWLTSDHDFLREIVVIYSLNFCFCYCCSSFATALVAVGLFCCCFWFSVFGFRYYLYFCCCDCCCCCSCSFFPYILNKHTYEACKKYFLHEVPATMPQNFNAKSTSSPSERSISVRRLRQTTHTHTHSHTSRVNTPTMWQLIGKICASRREMSANNVKLCYRFTDPIAPETIYLCRCAASPALTVIWPHGTLTAPLALCLSNSSASLQPLQRPR